MIPDFIEGKIWGNEGQRFLSHMEGCPDCREEMNIQYLVKEGIIRLEEDLSFDLRYELDELVNVCKNDYELRKKANLLLYFLEGLSFIIIMFLIVLVLIYK